MDKKTRRDPGAAAMKVARNCVAVRLRRLNRVVTRIYDDALRPHGITVAQMNILVVTANLGTTRPAEIAETLQLELSSLSRNLERMRSHGWLEEVADADARTRPFRITTVGSKVLGQLMPAWESAQSQAAELLGSDGVRWLDRASARVGSGLPTK